eukprot:10076080-Alexandrium_andersonii.AAC.1
MVAELAALLLQLAGHLGNLVANMREGDADTAATAGILTAVERLATIVRQMVSMTHLVPLQAVEGSHEQPVN